MAILVVGGGGIGAYLLLGREDSTDGAAGGDGDGDARSAAESYVGTLRTVLGTDLQDVDLHPLQPLACPEDYRKMDEDVQDARDHARTRGATPTDQPEADVTMADFAETSSGAAFTMTMSVKGDDHKDTREMTVAKEGGDWRVCGFYDDGDRPRPTADNPEDPDDRPSTTHRPRPTDGDPPATSRRLPPNPIPTTGTRPS